MSKINLAEGLKFAGFMAVVATAFWCPNIQKVFILTGSAFIAAGYFWSKLVK